MSYCTEESQQEDSGKTRPRHEYFGAGFQIIQPIRLRKGRPKQRPLWAQKRELLLRHAAGEKAMQRVRIAEMYWLENLPAAEIAKRLEISKRAVQGVIARLLTP